MFLFLVSILSVSFNSNYTYAANEIETKVEGTGTNIIQANNLVGQLDIKNTLQNTINNNSWITNTNSWTKVENTKIEDDLNEYLDKTGDKYNELYKTNNKVLNNTVSLNDLQDTIVDSFVETATDEDNSNIWNDFPWGQCTYYVAKNKLVTWRGNAGEWYYQASVSWIDVGKKAEVGAIVVFKWTWYSKYWHVWIVEGIEDNKIYISEMNARWKWVISYRYVWIGDRRIVGYIYTGNR